MRPWVRRLIFSVAAVVFGLGTIEVACRVFGPPPPPMFETQGLPLPDKLPGVRRILVFGASTARGWPVKEYGFGDQLGFHLRRLHGRGEIEVVNLAQPGTDSTETLTRMEAAIGSQPDLLLVAAFDNEFIAWHMFRGLAGWLGSASRWSGLARVLQRVVRRLDGDRKRQETMYDRIPPLLARGKERERIVARCRDNVTAMAALARRAGVPILFLSGVTNLVEWPPAHANLLVQDSGGQRRHALEAVRSLLAQGDPVAAIAEGDRWLIRFPDDAMLHFVSGRACVLAGRTKVALDYFRKARDLDLYPWRATDAINAAVRSAAQAAGSPAIDLQALFEAESPDALVGRDLVADNCHPTLRGHHLITKRIFEEIKVRHLLPGLGDASAQDIRLADFEDHLRASVPDKDLESLFVLTEAQWCLSLPFLHLEYGRTWLREAARRIPEDASVVATRGAEALLSGRREEGIALIRQALEPGRSTITALDLRHSALFLHVFRSAGLDLMTFE